MSAWYHKEDSGTSYSSEMTKIVSTSVCILLGFFLFLQQRWYRRAREFAPFIDRQSDSHWLDDYTNAMTFCEIIIIKMKLLRMTNAVRLVFNSVVIIHINIYFISKTRSSLRACSRPLFSVSVRWFAYDSPGGMCVLSFDVRRDYSFLNIEIQYAILNNTRDVKIMTTYVLSSMR